MSAHARPGFCCMGMQYACGHASTCAYDEVWTRAHDRMHAHDWWPQAFFWGSVWFALAVWVFVR